MQQHRRWDPSQDQLHDYCHDSFVQHRHCLGLVACSKCPPPQCLSIHSNNNSLCVCCVVWIYVYIYKLFSLLFSKDWVLIATGQLRDSSGFPLYDDMWRSIHPPMISSSLVVVCCFVHIFILHFSFIYFFQCFWGGGCRTLFSFRAKIWLFKLFYYYYYCCHYLGPHSKSCCLLLPLLRVKLFLGDSLLFPKDTKHQTHWPVLYHLVQSRQPALSSESCLCK